MPEEKLLKWKYLIKVCSEVNVGKIKCIEVNVLENCNNKDQIIKY